MSNSLHVAICIVGFRNPDDIEACLGALANADYRDFSVTICENGGAAAYEELAARLPPRLAGGQVVRAFDAHANLGYAGGVNACLRESSDAGAWWVLNPDTVAEPRALGRLVERLQRGDCHAVGATVHFADGVVESRGGRWRGWIARAVSLDFGKSLEAPASEAALEPMINYLSGASMLVGRAFLERAGPMREDYFLYCEEVEWCLRAIRRGLRLGLAIDARVLHNQGSTTGSVADIRQRSRMPVYLDERNKLLLTRDCFPGRLPVAAAASFLLLWLRFARRGAWRQLGYGIAGWRDGLRDRRGPP